MQNVMHASGNMKEDNMNNDFQPRSGMVYKFRTGNLTYWGFFIAIGHKLYRIGSNGANGLLYNNTGDGGMCDQIIEVYEGGVANPANLFNKLLGKPTNLGNLLWSKEPQTVELTIEEIAKKFNVKPEQVRIKENGTTE